ncbi:hypothetical protein GCM10018793_70920 [Streptomyces sulfonofaciens]|uniref:Uncharacterized protein n=1 Tax=Streptomyces sulfonofaciens TaxID=68272 RepID=A0A919L8Y4_9ACTN|nr:hypothetical protein GCM10018793_70920 [Streptomyces sulfonofaciens]
MYKYAGQTVCSVARTGRIDGENGGGAGVRGSMRGRGRGFGGAWLVRVGEIRWVETIWKEPVLLARVFEGAVADSVGRAA